MGYALLIILTLIGFFLLAAVLLVPVYRFLEREEQVSKRWTEDQLAERMREHRAQSNGTEEPSVSEGSDPTDP